MKAFMMPQTVPNSPTKGAVEPMVASRPVPIASRRPACASMRDRCEATRCEQPLAAGRSAARPPRPSFARRGAHHGRRRTASRADAALGFARGPARARIAPQRRGAAASLATRSSRLLAMQDRPGHQRGEDEADHHRLHDDVGRPIHAPWRQVARQPCVRRAVQGIWGFCPCDVGKVRCGNGAGRLGGIGRRAALRASRRGSMIRSVMRRAHFRQRRPQAGVRRSERRVPESASTSRVGFLAAPAELGPAHSGSRAG